MMIASRNPVLSSKLVLSALLVCVCGWSQEVRTWTSSSGKSSVRGEFWQVSKGVLQIRDSERGGITRLNLNLLSQQDVNYLLSRKSVQEESFEVARQLYVLGSQGELLPKDASLVRVKGVVEDVVGEDFVVVAAARRHYLVQVDAVKWKQADVFREYLVLRSRTLVDLGNEGQSGIYAVVSELTQEDYKKRLAADPRPLLFTITGSTPAYEKWLAMERRKAAILQQAERQAEIAKAKAEIEGKARTARLRKKQDKQLANLQEQYNERVARRRKIQATLEQIQHRRRNKKMTASAYTERRRELLAELELVEVQIVRLEADIRELKSIIYVTNAQER